MKHFAAMLILFLAATVLRAEESNAPVTRQEIELLKRQLAEVRDENFALRAKIEPLSDALSNGVAEKYGPGSVATGSTCKLTIGGLMQVWYYGIQNDSRGLFSNHALKITDVNAASDNDSFRVRRAQLNFLVDINKHVSAYFMFDPVFEQTSFPALPDNQGIFKRLPNSITGPIVSAIQTGAGTSPRQLQDAYILYRDILPHHELQLGQYKPPLSEEAYRSNALLDFAERSIFSQIENGRDLGAHIRGFWFDDRLQYWLGAFDGAGNYYLSAGQEQNRADDNDAKDFLARLLVRPVWNECAGHLELGAGGEFGIHGEAGSTNPIKHPVLGLNRQQTYASRLNAWLYYAAPRELTGLWLRGQWGRIHDRNAPSQVLDLLKQDLDHNGTQDNVEPFSSQFFSASAGYLLGDGPCASHLPWWARHIEPVFRYEHAQNVEVANQVRPYLTDVFATQIYTAGVNYYINGKGTKVQVNYNHVHNPDSEKVAGVPVFHQVKNDNFIINFQIAF
ncbi:MAG TPA: porin [Planctomycetota bacterium]|nr:porin [Planctomycetota bacterium]